MADSRSLVAQPDGRPRWPVMSTERKRLNTQIDGDMAAVLEMWQGRYKKSESEVVRVALAIGLQALREDPTPLGPLPLSAEDMSPPDLDHQVKAGKKRQTPDR